MSAWQRAGVALAWVGLLGPGCGEAREHPRFEGEIGALEIVETIPAPGSSEADPVTRIDLCLSAEVDPRALDDFDATLHSADLVFDARQEVQLFSWQAPGSRSALASTRWCPGSVLSLTPTSLLQPGLTYRVQLRPALLGWAGESLDTDQAGWALTPAGDLRWFFEFRIAGSPADSPPEELPSLPPGPTLSALFEPGEIFDPERAACGCHQRADELARDRLDLSDPQTAWSSLVLRTGFEATGFAMVTPRRPAESYLVHKLLRSADGQALHGLRGDPMPPDAPLPHADLVRIAHWIADGAQP
ncbi:MAG: Ig-like domain-containing protein [Enhygromyxa sp.]